MTVYIVQDGCRDNGGEIIGCYLYESAANEAADSYGICAEVFEREVIELETLKKDL
jgi:hypothetical protein